MYEELVEANCIVHNMNDYPRRKYRVDCPFCTDHGKSPDRDGCFSLFVNNWWGVCHRCGSKAHASTLLPKFGVTNLPRVSPTEAVESLSKTVKGIQDDNGMVLEEPPALPRPSGAWRKINAETLERIYMAPCRNLLRRWGIPESAAEACGWEWSVDRSTILFPTYMGGKLVFWQTRSLGDTRGGPSGSFENFGILGNWDCPLKDTVDTVYIVEGPKDSCAMYAQGMWAVQLHSHHMNRWQEERLKALPHRKVILLDADVAASSMKFEESGWEVAYLPKADPSKFGDGLGEVLKTATSLSAKVEQIVRAKQVEKFEPKFKRRL